MKPHEIKPLDEFDLGGLLQAIRDHCEDLADHAEPIIYEQKTTELKYKAYIINEIVEIIEKRQAFQEVCSRRD